MSFGAIDLTIYLDSSALVKLAVREAETQPLTAALTEGQDFAVSRVAEVEVLRAVFLAGGKLALARAVLDRCTLIELTRAVTQDAVTLPGRLRSLDAIHLASARQLRSDLEYLVTYDRRMLDAANSIWHTDSGPPLSPVVERGFGRLATLLADTLADTGLDPATLTLEVTETAVMSDADAALGMLHALKALGVRLAIGDFGTGYSSLVYLKRFPVDELKIDRSFVDGLGRDTEDTAIVTSIVQLAGAVGVQVVAEGVETDEQRNALLALGCQHGQGYLYGAPVPASQIRFHDGDGIGHTVTKNLKLPRPTDPSSVRMMRAELSNGPSV